jgi:shikimate kinase/3-dehydroquinate synthase
MNVYMMGFMGSGKTKVGKLLAQRLNYKFIDTDDCIVAEAGMSIPEIFEQQGEPAFREIEKEIVHRVSHLDDHVISLGGGAVVNPDNWACISSSGTTITLSYPPEIILKRVLQKKDRPLLNQESDKEKMQRIVDLLDKRKDFYKRADLFLHLNTEIDADRVADMIAGYLGVWA